MTYGKRRKSTKREIEASVKPIARLKVQYRDNTFEMLAGDNADAVLHQDSGESLQIDHSEGEEPIYNAAASEWNLGAVLEMIGLVWHFGRHT